MRRDRRTANVRTAVRLLGLCLVGTTLASAGAASGTPVDTAPLLPPVIPKPASMTASQGDSFTIDEDTRIVVAPGADAAVPIAQQLAALLRPSTGLTLALVRDTPTGSDVALALDAPATLGAEGYQLDVTGAGVRLSAAQPAGLFRGLQTLRQLLPPWAESMAVQRGPWTVPGVAITDRPRFAYRGGMLDVSRHFMSVDEVKRYIDDVALYKINHLHLHLSDDQGWRIAIEDWPDLTTIGGSLEVGGTPGGFYTQEQFRDLVAYAAERFVTVVPEIDTPGHTNAALASYAELNCDGVARSLYTGTAVGFSSLCVGKEITYQFLSDVISDIAAMAPGPYYHLGGDEAQVTPEADYITLIDRESQIVAAHGKTVMGWAEILQATTGAGSVAQFWAPRADTAVAAQARAKGARFVMSPASRAYMDMKYSPTTPLGLSWAGYIEVADAYTWDPVTFNPGVVEAEVLGVEAPVWTETLKDILDVEFMVFPRLPAIAELGWSPADGRSLPEFLVRLAAQGTRWMVRGTNFYTSNQVPWRADVRGAAVTTAALAFTGAVATVAAPGTTASNLAAVVIWDDGAAGPGTVTGTNATTTRVNGLATVTASRTFPGPGTYSGTVVVSRGSDTSTAPFAVTVKP